MRPRFLQVAGFSIASALACISGAVAGNFEVAPTTIVIAPGAQTATFFVANNDTSPAYIQFEAYDWRQQDGKDQLTKAQDMIISPPIVQLAPGRRQTIRLAINAPDRKIERSFRILASQLPYRDARQQQSVEVLLQFSLPVFAEAMGDAQARLQWSLGAAAEGAATLTVINSGSSHAKLTGVTLAAAGGQGMPVAPDTFAYVLPGAAHSWMIDAGKLPQGALEVSAQDEVSGALRAPVLLQRQP